MNAGSVKIPVLLSLLGLGLGLGLGTLPCCYVRYMAPFEGVVLRFSFTRQ